MHGKTITSEVSRSSLWAQCKQIILQMCASGAWDRSSRLSAIVLLYFACQFVFHPLTCGLYSSVRCSYQVFGLHPPLLWKLSSFLIMLATGAPELTGMLAVFANTLEFIVISVSIRCVFLPICSFPCKLCVSGIAGTPFSCFLFE